MQYRLLAIIGFTLAAVVACTAIRIEWLNYEAGGVLPNREYINGDPANGVATWRLAPTTEEGWRWFHLRNEQGQFLTRDLTVSERSQMFNDTHRAQAEATLRDLVSTLGLLQYPLILALTVLALLMFRKYGIKWAAPVGIIAVCAGTLMFYRAYWTSLGW